MKRLFNSDSGLFRFLTVLMELAQLNLLCLLFSLPVVTAGAAYSAMLDGLYTLSRNGEGCFSFSRFLHVFRRSLKSSLTVWCPGAAGALMLGYGFLYWMRTSAGTARILLCALYAAAAILLFGTVHFSLFCISRSGKWSRERLKDCFLIALARYPAVILLCAVTVSWLVLLALPGASLIRLLPLIVLYCIASPAYACVSLDIRLLKPFLPDVFEEEQADETDD